MTTNNTEGKIGMESLNNDNGEESDDVLCEIKSLLDNPPNAGSDTKDHILAALKVACKKEREDLVEFIVSRNDSVFHSYITSRRSRGGEIALLYSINKGDVDFVVWLLKRGVDANAKNRYGSTALMLSCPWFSSHKSNLVISKRTWNKKCELMVYVLLKYGADIHVRADEGTTALMHASYLKSKVVAEKLIERGAEINVFDNSGRCALLFACQRRSLNVVKLLCDNGADVNSRNSDGETVLLRIPLCVKPVVTLLEVSAKAGYSELVDGGKLFVIACSYRCMKIMKALLKYNVDVNTRDRKSKTPLMIACKSRYPEILKLLLQNGADINAQTDKGFTAIMQVVDSWHDNYECLGILLAAGADLELSDNRGRTVFSIFMSKIHRENKCLRLLLESGKLYTAKGNLKDVHKNAMNTCYNGGVGSVLIEFGIFDWKWCQMTPGEADTLSRTALSTGICPGQMRFSGDTASPLVYFFEADSSYRYYRNILTSLLKAMYYFPEDYVRLSTDKQLRAKIKNNTDLLCEFIGNPLPLFTWSFITVSKAISLAGNPCLRAQRVDSLPVPNKLKDLLNFRNATCW